MCTAVAGAAESNLDQPPLPGSLGWIKQCCLLVQRKEDLLNHLFGFAPVPQNAQSDTEYEACIAAIQLVKTIRIFGLQPHHQLFVSGRMKLGWHRGSVAFPGGAPH